MTYNQVADKNLEDLGSQALAVLEHLLEDPDEEVAQGGANKGAVGGHLRDAGREVVAILVAIFGEPRGEQLLTTC